MCVEWRCHVGAPDAASVPSTKRSAFHAAVLESSASHSAEGDSHASVQGDSVPGPKPGSIAAGDTVSGPAQPTSAGPLMPMKAPDGLMDTARPSRLPALPHELATAVPVPELA